ncbi:MAG: sensor histidine kinase, partial [Bacteroidota bacterium]
EITSKYESAKQENSILILQSENDRLELIKNRNRSFLIGAIGLLITGTILGFFYLKNQRRKEVITRQQHEIAQRDMLQELKRQELETIDKIIQTQDHERARIAADLHDSLGSKMATIKLYLDEMAESDVASITKVEDARLLIDQTYKETREITHQLNAGLTLEKGLIPAVRRLASHINASKQLRVEIIEVEADIQLDNAIEFQLLRVIQEAVTNVIKHADASQINIQFTGHDDALNVIIEDDGKGFDNETITAGLGITNILSRLQSVGASAKIDSSPGRGTTIIINTPR